MQSIALEQKGFALIVVTCIPYPLVVTSIDLINRWWTEGEWYLVGPTYFWSDLKILEVLPPSKEEKAHQLFNMYTYLAACGSSLQ